MHSPLSLSLSLLHRSLSLSPQFNSRKSLFVYTRKLNPKLQWRNSNNLRRECTVERVERMLTAPSSKMHAVCPFFFASSLTLSTSRSEKLTRTSGSSLSESDFALTFSLVSASCPQVCGHEKGHIWMHLSCSSHERPMLMKKRTSEWAEGREREREWNKERKTGAFAF